MDKKMVLFFAVFILFLGCAYASTVTRGLSSTTVQPGSDLTVTLAVDVTGSDTFYAIDELVASGWTVKDAGTGATGHSGHIKWVVIQDAADRSYSYTLTAPSQAGAASFAGTYLFEGMATEAPIGGQSQVTVSSAVTPPPPDYTLIGIAAVVVIIVLVIAFKKLVK